MKRHHRRMLAWTIFFVVMFVINLFAFPYTGNKEKQAEKVRQFPETVEVKEDWEYLLPELVAVCACESMGDPNATPQQWNKDGTIKYYKGNYGMCQINKLAHDKRTKELGLDVYKSAKDNALYANMLFEESGYAPWHTWSGHCWENNESIDKSML